MEILLEALEATGSPSRSPAVGQVWMRTDDLREAVDLMKPDGEGVLQKRRVSRRVNSSKAPADDPTLIEEVKLAA